MCAFFVRKSLVIMCSWLSMLGYMEIGLFVNIVLRGLKVILKW